MNMIVLVETLRTDIRYEHPEKIQPDIAKWNSHILFDTQSGFFNIPTDSLINR